jgi:hypothetical protein
MDWLRQPSAFEVRKIRKATRAFDKGEIWYTRMVSVTVYVKPQSLDAGSDGS